MMLFSACAHAEDKYADYQGKRQIWNEDAAPGKETSIDFYRGGRLARGQVKSPELSELLRMPGRDGLLIGEAGSQTDPRENTSVTVELPRHTAKLLLTFAPPESEYVRVLAVRSAE